MLSLPIILFVSSILALLPLSTEGIQTDFQNSPPRVSFSSPVNGATFQWNTLIPYSVTVVDAEDGSSEFDEIPGNQVMLSIRYLSDSIQLKSFLSEDAEVYKGPLLAMSSTTCFNCHQMKTKLIGPSFESISMKYPYNEAVATSLAQKVISGTTGTWGEVAMPPHPELPLEKVKEIVRWILRKGADPDQNYLVGISGVFKTKARTIKESKKEVYVLTARYADRGDKQTNSSIKIGQQVIVLKSKP